jgi:thioester reductase-like protein
MEGRIKIVRVGQLTGDTKNGIWNMSEAWPLMLSTVQELKCLPKIEQSLDWLPLDVAAQAVVDIALANAVANDLVYHVLNNRANSTWDDLLRWLQEFEAETFKVVEPSLWLKRLEATKGHPAKRLSWLWEKAYRNADGRKKSNITFTTKRAVKASEVMRQFPGVDRELVRKIWNWIEKEMTA